MNRLSKETLRSLGGGESIDAVCRAAGISRDEFQTLWKATAAARVPRTSGSVEARGYASCRNRAGSIRHSAHLCRESDEDLFVGFGYAMAQDRLFQLDWLRRKGAGRLAEILGNDGLPLRPPGAHGWTEPHRTGRMGSTAGGDATAACRLQRGDQCGHRAESATICRSNSICSITVPSRGRSIDCLLIENEFRWYLTGRFPGHRHSRIGPPSPGRRSALSGLSDGRIRRREHSVARRLPDRAERDRAGRASRRASRTPRWAATTGS